MQSRPLFLPFSEPDSWVPVKKAFLPLSLFSLVSFLLVLVSLGAQCFPAHGSGALGKQGEAWEQPVRQQQAAWLLLMKGDFKGSALGNLVLAEMELCVRTAGSCQGTQHKRECMLCLGSQIFPSQASRSSAAGK